MCSKIICILRLTHSVTFCHYEPSISDIPTLFLPTCINYKLLHTCKFKVTIIVYWYWFRKACHKVQNCGMITLIFDYIRTVHIMQFGATSERAKPVRENSANLLRSILLQDINEILNLIHANRTWYSGNVITFHEGRNKSR